MGMPVVDIETRRLIAKGTKEVEKTNIFGNKYWDLEDVEVFGYVIWYCGEAICERYDFDDEDEAYDDAVSFLDEYFGDNGWVC